MAITPCCVLTRSWGTKEVELRRETRLHDGWQSCVALHLFPSSFCCLFLNGVVLFLLKNTLPRKSACTKHALVWGKAGGQILGQHHLHVSRGHGCPWKALWLCGPFLQGIGHRETWFLVLPPASFFKEGCPAFGHCHLQMGGLASQICWNHLKPCGTMWPAGWRLDTSAWFSAF